MHSQGWRRRPRSGDDRGFGLVEAIVSIMILGVIFTALGLTMQSSLVATARSKQFQSATQLISERLEQTRALAYDTLKAGASATAVQSAVAAGETDGGRLAGSGESYTFNGERLLTHGQTTSEQTPLNPYREQVLADGVDLTLATYATECYQPKASPGSCAATEQEDSEEVIRVTVVASWTPPHSDTQMELRNESLVYSPESCFSTSTHPFSAPCQAFLYAGAAGGGGSISVQGLDPTDPTVPVGLFGSAAKAITVQLPSATAALQAEQSGRATTALRGALITVDNLDDSTSDATHGGDSETALATSDPARPGTTASATLAAAAVSQELAGNGNLGLTAAGAAASGTAAATMQSTGSPACVTAAGTSQTVGSPVCASASLTTAGTSGVSVAGSHAGADLDMTLVSVSSPTGTTRAHAGAYWAANAGSVCADAATPGCAAGDSRSFAGQIMVGSLPASMSPPPGWQGAAVIIDGLQSDVTVERGTGAAAPGAPELSGSPTVRVWNGTGYSSTQLSTVTSATDIDIGTASVSSGTVTVELIGPPAPGGEPAATAGTVTIGDRVATTDGPSDCGAVCSATGTFGGVTVNLQLVIREGANPVARLAVTASVLAQQSRATFEPAPS